MEKMETGFQGIFSPSLSGHLGLTNRVSAPKSINYNDQQQQFLMAEGEESLKPDRVVYPQSPPFIKPAVENWYNPTRAPQYLTGNSVFSFRIPLFLN